MVGYRIVVVVVGDVNVVIVVVAFCKLSFVIVLWVLKLRLCYFLDAVVLIDCRSDGRVLQ